MKTFKVAEVSEKIENYKNSILDFCVDNDFSEERNELKEQLDNMNKENKILITFIGQYSAGKSTIVSALTGRSDIKIDADIATSEVTKYKWFDQLFLVDTPGLHTENKEHDELTREAILKSDILVYCITNELFDTITKKDYIDLIYEKNYKGKVFLLINKMSREFGEYNNLKENYIESINDSLFPYNIEDVTYNFIDAKDYIDGIKEDSHELIEDSHFEEFIENLNIFVEDKRILGKLSKYIDVMIISIDDLISKNIENMSDKNTINIMNRLNRKVINSKNHLEKKSLYIVNDELSKLREYGNQMARDMGNTDINEEEINANIIKISDNINLRLENVRMEYMDSLKEELNLTLDSNQGELFFENFKNQPEFKNFDFSDKDHVSKILNFIDEIPKNGPILNSLKIPLGDGAKK